MTESREEQLTKSLADLRSRHNRLLMKYIELEDNYNDLKEKLDTMAEINRLRNHANYTLHPKFEEKEKETAALYNSADLVSGDIQFPGLEKT